MRQSLPATYLRELHQTPSLFHSNLSSETFVRCCTFCFCFGQNRWMCWTSSQVQHLGSFCFWAPISAESCRTSDFDSWFLSFHSWWISCCWTKSIVRSSIHVSRAVTTVENNWQKGALPFHPTSVNIIWCAYGIPLSVVYQFSGLVEVSMSIMPHCPCVLGRLQWGCTLSFQFTLIMTPLWYELAMGGIHNNPKVCLVRTWKQDQWVQGYPVGKCEHTIHNLCQIKKLGNVAKFWVQRMWRIIKINIKIS